MLINLKFQDYLLNKNLLFYQLKIILTIKKTVKKIFFSHKM